MINLALIVSNQEHLDNIEVLQQMKEIRVFCFTKKEWMSTLKKSSNIIFEHSLDNINKIENLSIILSDQQIDGHDLALPIGVPLIDSASFKFFQKILKEIANIEKEFKDSIEAQKIISDLGVKLTSSKNMEELSNAILNCALSLTKTPAGSIALYDEKNNMLNLLVDKGFSSDFSQIKTYPVRKDGMNEYVLKHNEPVVINNIEHAQSFNNPLMLKEVVTSLIAVPLICEGKKVGILYVDDFVPRNFLPEQVTSLSLLAMQAAFGIEKFHLLNQLENKNQELNNKTDYLKAILNNSADMIVTTDSNTKVVEFNSAGENILGYKKEEVVGKSVECLYRSSEERQKIMKKVEKFGLITNYETKLRAKDGRMVDISLSLSQLKDKNGNIIGTVGISKDITKQKQLEKKLRDSNKELGQKIKEVQKIDKMKSDFLSIVSHELRTPLTSILGFAKMIQKKFTTNIIPSLNMNDEKNAKSAEKIQENLKIITNEGERLSRLINNFLDLAKIEAGKIEWKIEPSDIVSICNSAIYSTSSLADDKKISLKLIHDENLPKINADKDKLIQVVTNLISNSVKFTDTGFITCTIKKIENNIEVRIIDTGIGIKPEYLTKVFEKFKQVTDDNADTLGDRPKGTGLGLTICKEIIEYHQGKIWVESVYGQGSSFIFTIPVLKENILQKIDSQVPSISKNKFIDTINKKQQEHLILIVDDEEHIRTLLREQLEDEGYRVIEASDGNDALPKARNEKPDLIICDILMPGINGFDVLTLLKANEQTSNIPILIHSIYEDKEKGYRLGADEYITKSINTEHVIKAVSDLLSGNKAPRRKKALLIEEDTTVLKSIQDVLHAKGYEVVSASNDREGLEKAKKENPDLILIDDIVSNNSEILEALKSDKNVNKSNIIILTRDK
ncbi:response regulator [Candidatus Poribacteria bacterium]|nr:response regulator [Candidatus Poribacteria bacterium]